MVLATGHTRNLCTYWDCCGWYRSHGATSPTLTLFPHNPATTHHRRQPTANHSTLLYLNVHVYRHFPLPIRARSCGNARNWPSAATAYMNAFTICVTPDGRSRQRAFADKQPFVTVLAVILYCNGRVVCGGGGYHYSAIKALRARWRTWLSPFHAVTFAIIVSSPYISCDLTCMWHSRAKHHGR